MLVVVENDEDEDEDVDEDVGLEIRDGKEMGKEKGKEEGREAGRDRSRETGLGRTPGTTTAETGVKAVTCTGAGVITDEKHVPRGIFTNQGSKISLYVQREIPGPDKRAHNVSGLFYRQYRNLNPLFLMCSYSIVYHLMYTCTHLYLY